MDIITEFYYNNKMVFILFGHHGLMPGDMYSHKTHATDFNVKIESKLPDGMYKVESREWIHHMASGDKMTLIIYLVDIRKEDSWPMVDTGGSAVIKKN